MKTYKLNPKNVDKDGNEVDQHPEDRTIVITEEVDQSLLDQLPESVRSQISNEEERVTIANLKYEHVEKVEAAKNAIKEANKIAQKINSIVSEFPDLGITGKPTKIIDEDKIIEIDSKKPTLRKKK